MASILKVDELQGKTSAGAVTITSGTATMSLQEGVAKHFVNYDAPNTTTDSSFNQSSLTDYATGEFKSLFTNSFSSATDKVHVTSAFNSADDGSNVAAARTRGGVNSGVCTLYATQAPEALSTSGVQFFSSYGSTGSADGTNIDLSATYMISMGDLA
jgi:hypothetical protein